MRFMSGWFILFLVVTFVLGWGEAGICYLFAKFVADNMVVFLPLLGLFMTINLMLSCGWMMIVDEAEKTELRKKVKESLVQLRKRTR